MRECTIDFDQGAPESNAKSPFGGHNQKPPEIGLAMDADRVLS
jgi:hypothetical protein